MYVHMTCRLCCLCITQIIYIYIYICIYIYDNVYQYVVYIYICIHIISCCGRLRAAAAQVLAAQVLDLGKT